MDGVNYLTLKSGLIRRTPLEVGGGGVGVKQAQIERL